ncbi:hypothetical protein [Burkholderia ubonensis]|nr:hypothetical protein [Burkholderia ubonensis]
MPTLLSFPLSPEWANRIYVLANILAILAAVVAAIAAFVSFRTSQIRDYYSDQRRLQYEAISEGAKADAARANESAATATENTEKLRQSNLLLQRQAEHERSERLKLEAKVAPRTLAADDGDRLQAKAQEFCRQVVRIPVTAANGNQEAQRYAMELVQRLRNAGCESDLSLPIPGLRPEVEGVHIGIRNIDQRPPQAGLLSQILTAGQVEHNVAALAPDFFPDDQWVLIVGAKPLPLPK